MSLSRSLFPSRIAAILLLCAGASWLPRAGAAQTVDVINMIPSTLSVETHQDSEPDLTVNPNDPDEIVASAFTRNPTGASNPAPIYISQDGGATWVLNNIVPSGNGMTGDITVSLTRNNVLYAGILRGGSGFDMRILRSIDYTSPGTMTQLMGRTDEDQPYARAYAPMGGAQRDRDHLYVGHNDFNNLPSSASLEQSLNAETTPPPAGLGVLRLERRTPLGQDGPPIRQAIHADGTVYSAYTQRTARTGTIRTGNIVVVRDDDWGLGANPYSDLRDPSDNVAGRFVVAGVSWVFNPGAVFGQERMGDRLSIAVDPTDSETVYIAWADRPPGMTGNTATVHLRRSTDGGATWSADLRTIESSMTSQVAVNIRGDVGFLYQQLTGTAPDQRWETHFQQSTDGGGTWSEFLLADTLANNPRRTFLPYLGDYLGLTAVGKDFYGVFSASNLPDSANFPQGVIYQRSADFGAQTLDDGSGNPVAVSIDPFFFRVGNLEPRLDFYVRDWTDSAVDNDIGLEPSTDPAFYTTSDVWNRRANASGGFDGNDRPISEDPQNSTLGMNYAFARVHRKSTGSAETVSLHFLKSEFGTGSNYEDAGTAPDPTLPFASFQQVRTMANGYPWLLNATSSSHTCLAVEITTADDPIVPPSLLGHAPGWPDTDLMVLYDNNKAQRNMGVYADGGIAGEGCDVTYWAVIHNAATFRRDFELYYEANPTFLELHNQPRFVSVGPSGETPQIEQDRIVFPAMDPGESRWLGLTVLAGQASAVGSRARVDFFETVGGEARNGFTIAVEKASFEAAAAGLLDLHVGNLWRLGNLLSLPDASQAARDTGPQIPALSSRDAYIGYVDSIFEPYRSWIDTALKVHQEDPFGLQAKISKFEVARATRSADRILPAQGDLEHALDAYLTYYDKQLGDTADIAQNMRWQADLFRSLPALRSLAGAKEVVRTSLEFDSGYSHRRLSGRDYPAYVGRLLPILERADNSLSLGFAGPLRQLATSVSAGDPQSAQKFHRAFLLRLEGLR